MRTRTRSCKKIVKEAKKDLIAKLHVTIHRLPMRSSSASGISEIEGVRCSLGAAENFRLIEVVGWFLQKGGFFFFQKKKWGGKTEKKKVLASEISRSTIYNNAYSINDGTRLFLKVFFFFFQREKKWLQLWLVLRTSALAPEAKAEAIPLNQF